MPKEITTDLAAYRSIRDYDPRFSDFVVRCGWFRSWVGVVSDYDAKTGVISIVLEGTPRLLFTLSQEEMAKNTYTVKLDTVKNGTKYGWYIQQVIDGEAVWYI